MSQEFFDRYGPGGTKDQESYMRNKATADEIGHVLHSNEPEEMKKAALQNSNITPEHLRWAANSNNTRFVGAAVSHPKANEHILAIGMNHHNGFIRSDAIEHPNFTPELMKKVMTDPRFSTSDRLVCLRHKNTNQEIAHIGANSDHSTVRKFAAVSDHISSDDLYDLMSDDFDAVRKNAMSSRMATSDQLETRIADPNEKDIDVKLYGMTNPNLSTDALHRLSKHPDNMVAIHAKYQLDNRK